MTHHIYRTTGLVLASTIVGETNRQYLLFTESLGTIRATAQGVRLAKSKLKYALQPLSLGLFSLVKGRQGWKIVNALPEKSYYQKFKQIEQKKGVTTRVTALLKRLIQGEEVNQKLFTIVTHHFDFLETVTEDQSLFVEYSLVVNMLTVLGYMSSGGATQMITQAPLTKETLAYIKDHRREVLEMINQSLKATQL